MNKEQLSILLLENAIRWFSNVLTEIGGNYGKYLPEDVTKELHEVIMSIDKLSSVIRKYG